MFCRVTASGALAMDSDVTSSEGGGVGAQGRDRQTDQDN